MSVNKAVALAGPAELYFVNPSEGDYFKWGRGGGQGHGKSKPFSE